ncbi:hypothetical protein SAMN05414139_09754 [Burkholderia sp. D7]|nr:hypothetical protein SAMN05414139_09754 [Burkholderia sp. D7]
MLSLGLLLRSATQEGDPSGFHSDTLADRRQ